MKVAVIQLLNIISTTEWSAKNKQMKTLPKKYALKESKNIQARNCNKIRSNLMKATIKLLLSLYYIMIYCQFTLQVNIYLLTWSYFPCPLAINGVPNPSRVTDTPLHWQ